MTNEEYIRTQMTAKELAALTLYHFESEDWDYDWDESLFSWGKCDTWRTSDGMEYDDYEAALEHEVWWFKEERNELTARWYDS